MLGSQSVASRVVLGEHEGLRVLCGSYSAPLQAGVAFSGGWQVPYKHQKTPGSCTGHARTTPSWRLAPAGTLKPLRFSHWTEAIHERAPSLPLQVLCEAKCSQFPIKQPFWLKAISQACPAQWASSSWPPGPAGRAESFPAKSLNSPSCPLIFLLYIFNLKFSFYLRSMRGKPLSLSF